MLRNTIFSYFNLYGKEAGFVLFMKLGLIATLLISIIYFIFHFSSKNKIVSNYLSALYRTIKKPLLVIFLTYCGYLGILAFEIFYAEVINEKTKDIIGYLLGISEIIATIWLVSNIITLIKQKLLSWAINTEHTTIQYILPAISDSLSAAFLLLMLNLFIPALDLSGTSAEIMSKTLKVLFIATLGWICFQILSTLENLIVEKYVTKNDNLMLTRKVRTQVTILKRIVGATILIVTLATILMVFDSVKNLGAGILTTAGLISAIGAFASQQTLGRLFAGLQLAFTQPIRIGDTVIIDNEFGQVEEITLSYVIVKLWDLRRLIKPTDYFTSQGILNLTRESTQLLGTIFIYCDYTLPIESIRNKFTEFLQSSKHWDKKASALEVTDVTEKCMQLRALVSAENSGSLWKLRCEIREKLIAYIASQHPECLPITRQIKP